MTNLELERITKKFNQRYNAAWEAAADKIDQNRQDIRAAGNNSILKRQLLKKYYIDNLEGLKLVGEVLQSFEDEVGVDLPDERLAIGEQVAYALMEIEQHKIRLSKEDYKAVFNIGEDHWQTHYSKKTPEGSHDVLFYRKLSQEPFAKFYLQYLLEQIMDDSHLRNLLMKNVLGKRWWSIGQITNWRKITEIFKRAFGINEV